jgi:hypothetical protein
MYEGEFIEYKAGEINPADICMLCVRMFDWRVSERRNSAPAQPVLYRFKECRYGPH